MGDELGLHYTIERSSRNWDTTRRVVRINVTCYSGLDCVIALSRIGKKTHDVGYSFMPRVVVTIVFDNTSTTMVGNS